MTPAEVEALALHEESLDVRCEHCGAEPRYRCVNPRTGLEARVPHLVRRRAADVSI